MKIYQEITSGMYKEIEWIPSVEALTDQFNVTEKEIKAAIGDLIYEGVLTRDPKDMSKIKVSKPYKWDVVRGNHSFSNEAKSRNQKINKEILNFEKLRVWPQVQELLKLNDDDEVIILERLLSADGYKVGIESFYLPVDLYSGVSRSMFEEDSSSFEVMQEKFGLISHKAIDSLAASTLEPREAKLLGLDIGTPVLLRYRVIISPIGIPLKGSKAIYLFNPGYDINI